VWFTKPRFRDHSRDRHQVPRGNLGQSPGTAAATRLSRCRRQCSGRERVGDRLGAADARRVDLDDVGLHGSHLLGAAGILTGLEATTHWSATDRLASYGAIYVARRVVVQGKVVTAVGCLPAATWH
jgi:hypothetical protein